MFSGYLGGEGERYAPGDTSHQARKFLLHHAGWLAFHFTIFNTEDFLCHPVPYLYVQTLLMSSDLA